MRIKTYFLIFGLLAVFGVKKTAAQNPLNNFDLIGFHHIIDQGDYYKVYLKVSLSSQYSPKELTLFVDNDRSYSFMNDTVLQTQIENEFIFEFEKNKNEVKGNSIRLFVTDKLAKTLLEQEIHLPAKEDLKYPDFAILKEPSMTPLFHGYTNPDQQLRFLDSKQDESLYAFYYSKAFGHAKPPMVTDFLPEEAINVDKVIKYNSEQSFSLSDKGLYLFQKDTNSLVATSVLSKKNTFPELRSINDLIESFRYLLKGDEYSKLIESENPKTDFDALVLKLAPTKNAAKELIRNYFFRVKIANLFFTTYKEGWKTDMGMIFIIFGNPDVINKSKNQVTWTYFKLPGQRSTKFTFKRIESIFSKNHYVLERKKSFSETWFRLVSLWREGRIR
ncbi:MAG: GWxTD domain-containing protein [Bacteroidota bacterium]